MVNRMDDSISRQAVLDMLEDINNHINEGCKYRHDWCVEWVKGLPSIDAEPQWIPVTERLPERETAVLITDEDEEVNVAYWDYEEWVEDPIVEWRCGNWNVEPVAWMPLPKPYGERKEE